MPNSTRNPGAGFVIVVAFGLCACPSEELSEPTPCPTSEFEVHPDVVYGVDGEWPRVALNELMARNRATVEDPTGRRPDWIELVNLTGDSVDLGGWSLSDDPEEPDKHVLDPTSIDAGRYLLLWADNDARLGPAHLDFNLDSAGDALGLYAPDGTTMDLLTFGPQAADVSLARTPDGTGAWALRADSTPGGDNGSGR